MPGTARLCWGNPKPLFLGDCQLLMTSIPTGRSAHICGGGGVSMLTVWSAMQFSG